MELVQQHLAKSHHQSPPSPPSSFHDDHDDGGSSQQQQTANNKSSNNSNRPPFPNRLMMAEAIEENKMMDMDCDTLMSNKKARTPKLQLPKNVKLFTSVAGAADDDQHQHQFDSSASPLFSISNKQNQRQQQQQPSEAEMPTSAVTSSNEKKNSSVLDPGFWFKHTHATSTSTSALAATNTHTPEATTVAATPPTKNESSDASFWNRHTAPPTTNSSVTTPMVSAVAAANTPEGTVAATTKNGSFDASFWNRHTAPPTTNSIETTPVLTAQVSSSGASDPSKNKFDAAFWGMHTDDASATARSTVNNADNANSSSSNSHSNSNEKQPTPKHSAFDATFWNMHSKTAESHRSSSSYSTQSTSSTRTENQHGHSNSAANASAAAAKPSLKSTFDASFWNMHTTKNSSDRSPSVSALNKPSQMSFTAAAQSESRTPGMTSAGGLTPNHAASASAAAKPSPKSTFDPGFWNMHTSKKTEENGENESSINQPEPDKTNTAETLLSTTRLASTKAPQLPLLTLPRPAASGGSPVFVTKTKTTTLTHGGSFGSPPIANQTMAAAASFDGAVSKNTNDNGQRNAAAAPPGTPATASITTATATPGSVSWKAMPPTPQSFISYSSTSVVTRHNTQQHTVTTSSLLKSLLLSTIIKSPEVTSEPVPLQQSSSTSSLGTPDSRTLSTRGTMPSATTTNATGSAHSTYEQKFVNITTCQVINSKNRNLQYTTGNASGSLTNTPMSAPAAAPALLSLGPGLPRLPHLDLSKALSLSTAGSPSPPQKMLMLKTSADDHDDDDKEEEEDAQSYRNATRIATTEVLKHVFLRKFYLEAAKNPKNKISPAVTRLASSEAAASGKAKAGTGAGNAGGIVNMLGLSGPAGSRSCSAMSSRCSSLAASPQMGSNGPTFAAVTAAEARASAAPLSLSSTMEIPQPQANVSVSSFNLIKGNIGLQRMLLSNNFSIYFLSRNEAYFLLAASLLEYLGQSPQLHSSLLMSVHKEDDGRGDAECAPLPTPPEILPMVFRILYGSTHARVATRTLDNSHRNLTSTGTGATAYGPMFPGDAAIPRTSPSIGARFPTPVTLSSTASAVGADAAATPQQDTDASHSHNKRNREPPRFVQPRRDPFALPSGVLHVLEQEEAADQQRRGVDTVLQSSDRGQGRSSAANPQLAFVRGRDNQIVTVVDNYDDNSDDGDDDTGRDRYTDPNLSHGNDFHYYYHPYKQSDDFFTKSRRRRGKNKLHRSAATTASSSKDDHVSADIRQSVAEFHEQRLKAIDDRSGQWAAYDDCLQRKSDGMMPIFRRFGW